LKILTYIITSITAHPVRLTALPAKMSVLTFKTAVILYIWTKYTYFMYNSIYLIWGYSNIYSLSSYI